jgi:type IV pilus assembly protein PilB
MLAPSLLLVVAQRLARKLCPDCKEAYEPGPEERKNANLKCELVYRAKGCGSCNNTGYKGRVCVAEVMAVNPQIQELINQKASFQKVREAARSTGMQTLYESSIRKAEQGVTSLEEALSISLGAE